MLFITFCNKHMLILSERKKKSIANIPINIDSQATSTNFTSAMVTVVKRLKYRQKKILK